MPRTQHNTVQRLLRPNFRDSQYLLWTRPAIDNESTSLPHPSAALSQIGGKTASQLKISPDKRRCRREEFCIHTKSPATR
jgi:hypothetical protein